MIAQEDLVANILTKTVLCLTQWSTTSKLEHRIARLSVFLNKDSIRIIYIGTRQLIDISIRYTYCRGACYLCDKTRHFVCKCPNQKTQIRAVLHVMTSEERQAWADEVRELDENSAEEE